jgi:hypothetical protein
MFTLLTDASMRDDYARRAQCRARHFSPEHALLKWHRLIGGLCQN